MAQQSTPQPATPGGYTPASTNEEIMSWQPGDLLRLKNSSNAKRGDTYEFLGEREVRHFTQDVIWISVKHIKSGEVTTGRRGDRFVKV